MIGRNRRGKLVLIVLSVTASAVLAICPFVGIKDVPLSALLGDGEDGAGARQVFWQIRVPRVLMGFAAGAGLAVCGMAFQAMFQNALATPFTLGVAGGASLGAAVYVHLGIPIALGGISGVSLFAFGGALAAISLVYGLTRLRRGFSTVSMLLAGVAVNLFFSSLVMFIQYLSDFTATFQITRWLMGGLHVMGYRDLLGMLPFVGVGVGVLTVLTRELNLLTLGEELAASRGVNVHRVKLALFVVTSLCVGGVVAACGPIGFVGLVAPHLCRLLIGGNHRWLLPATCLFGGLFLTLCDTAARVLIAPAEIPVGIIMSLLGGPFFIWLLVRSGGAGMATVSSK
jgi:iron complex transport system permease protein